MAREYSNVLVLDWETTGIPETNNPCFWIGPQGIQIGCCAVEDPYDKWTVMEEFSATIQWIGEDPSFPQITWSVQAERVHKLTRTDLRNAEHPQDAGHRFADFVKRYFDRSNKILLAGHNPWFDLYFTRQLLFFADFIDDPDIVFNHRMLDSHTAGFFLLGTNNSNDLFTETSNFKRDGHNALEDARLTTDAFREMTKRLGGIVAYRSQT